MTVVFADGRDGAMQVELDQHVIRLIKDGTPISSQTWNSLVKAGAHLEQVMVLPKMFRRKCFFPECISVSGLSDRFWFVGPSIPFGFSVTLYLQ